MNDMPSDSPMTAPDAFQLSIDAAEVYESRFVPALFGRWAPVLVDMAGVRPGQTIVDVGCGTGVVARTAADRLAGRGVVIGIDLNEGMLAVARRLRPDIEWRQADAAELPVPDGSVDIVLCQAALMFVRDPGQALREMRRILGSAGTAVIHVWSALEAQTGWAPFYDVIRRHAGPTAVDLVSSYWRLGDLDALVDLCSAAGLRIDKIHTRQEPAAFASIDDFVATELTGTPLQERITDSTYADILHDARVVLAPFLSSNGLEIPIEGHIVLGHPTA